MLTVTNSTIANNTADEAGGGGILNRGGFVTVRDSSIIGNETGAFGFGGGMRMMRMEPCSLLTVL